MFSSGSIRRGLVLAILHVRNKTAFLKGIHKVAKSKNELVRLLTFVRKHCMIAAMSSSLQARRAGRNVLHIKLMTQSWDKASL